MNIRLSLITICLSFSLGILSHWDWNYIGLCVRWQVWHEHFTNCHFVAERKHGAEVLIAHPARGLTPRQALKLFGTPDVRWWMRLTPYGPVPGVKMDGTPTASEIETGRVLDCWFYTKQHYIGLDFKRGVCVSAWPSPNRCEHML